MWMWPAVSGWSVCGGLMHFSSGKYGKTWPCVDWGMGLIVSVLPGKWGGQGWRFPAVWTDSAHSCPLERCVKCLLFRAMPQIVKGKPRECRAQFCRGTSSYVNSASANLIGMAVRTLARSSWVRSLSGFPNVSRAYLSLTV